MSLARATLSGQVIGEPEKRYTPNNQAVTNFTIQIAASGKMDAPFTVRVTCWRNLADVVVEQVHKDDMVTVEGRLQINQFEAPGGQTRRTFEVDASNVYLGTLQGLAPAFEGRNANNSQDRQMQEFGPVTPGANTYAGVVNPPVTAGVANRTAPAAAPKETFVADDFLTEDDIPF